MRAALVRITLATALCLGAAGCGDDSPAPKPYAGPSKSATPTGAPSMPAAAKGTTAASAKAFVAYYMNVLSYAASTGTTAQLQALASVDCAVCKKLTANIARTYEAGGKNVGKGYESEVFSVTSKNSEDGLTLEGTVSIFPQVSYPSATASPSRSKGGPAKSRITLERIKDEWRLAN